MAQLDEVAASQKNFATVVISSPVLTDDIRFVLHFSSVTDERAGA